MGAGAEAMQDHMQAVEIGFVARTKFIAKHLQGVRINLL